MHATTIPSAYARLGLGMALGLCCHTASAQVTFISLGTLGGRDSYASGMSADGTVVVGSSRVTGDARTHAFRWTLVGGMEDITPSNGVVDAGAYRVSADGRVAVGAATAVADYPRAIRWTAETGMQDLGTLGGLSSSAFAVSADGSIVAGRSGTHSLDPMHMCRWRVGPSGVVAEDLGSLAPGKTACAFAISADGSVLVGESETSQQYTVHAVRWTNGTLQDLGTLGGTNSTARGISADASVIVGRSDSVRQFNAPYLHSGTGLGRMSNLALAIPAGSYLFEVSADGTTVVGGQDPAWVWSAGLGWVDLNIYLPTLGVDLTGWTLFEARSVSADGTCVAGNGYLNGQVHAWLVRGLPSMCAADLDDGSRTGAKDRAVTVDDLLYSLEQSAGGNIAADLDDGSGYGVPDGAVTIDDLLFFLAHYEAGC